MNTFPTLKSLKLFLLQDRKLSLQKHYFSSHPFSVQLPDARVIWHPPYFIHTTGRRRSSFHHSVDVEVVTRPFLNTTPFIFPALITFILYSHFTGILLNYMFDERTKIEFKAMYCTALSITPQKHIVTPVVMDFLVLALVLHLLTLIIFILRPSLSCY